MTARSLGNELLRYTLLLYRGRFLWQRFSFQGQEGNLVAVSARLHAGLPRLWTAQQKGRSLVGYCGTTARFYCQDGTRRQGLRPDDPEGTVELPSSFEGGAVAVPSAEREKHALFGAQLQACNSPTDVLDLISQEPITVKRVSHSLTRIWKTTKYMSEEQRRYERQLMFEHPTFNQLCQQAMLSAPRMNKADIAFSLLAMVKLGVPQHSRVIQTLLRAVQENLNDFDEKALSVLANCLEDMESSKNVDALRQGLRLLVEDRVPGIQSVTVLQRLIRCVGKDAPLSLKRKLQYMVTTLAAADLSFKPLLDICSRMIAEDVHNIPYYRLVNVLKACKELNYRDLHLLSALTEYLTSTFDMWSNKKLVLFLLLFKELGYRPGALLDKFLERLIQDPNSLTLKDVLSVLKICSQLNHVPQQHKQEFLESMTQVFESYLLKMSATDLLRGVHSLCILGHFPVASLERLLQRETLDELLAQDSRMLRANQRKLHYVDLCLRLDRPSLPEHLTVPPVTTDLSFPDCVATLPQKRPDLHSPSDGEGLSPEPCRRLAVVRAPSSSFCFGTSHPRGWVVLMMRHLRALGYSPVLVPAHQFDSLSEEDSVEALRNLVFAEEEDSCRTSKRPEDLRTNEE
ncbi:hypothetical protein JZ751_029339 [Albula glossodonta]|uniref:RAP domain-containing protein n=1 Tax=Albula glossodonta TaxID=121402 RepID=A0A8T2PCU1_9TELE|nr:hypothetical protein JZ751_029339 [Albula glossodonta]